MSPCLGPGSTCEEHDNTFTCYCAKVPYHQPNICHFWYATTILMTIKSTPYNYKCENSRQNSQNRPKFPILCAEKYASLKKVITITAIINIVDSGPDREVLREGDRNGRPCCCWLHWIQSCCGKSWNLSLTLFHRAAIFKLTILNANARILLQRESNI